MMAWLVGASATVTRAIAVSDGLFWGLLFAQLVVVLTLSSCAQRLAASMTRLLFVLYASLTGVVLPFAMQAFTAKSMTATFLMTAGMLVGLAIHVARTQRRLAAFGHVLFIGLVGLVLASAAVLLWPRASL
jgi:FtsH-binding integral membrane protein